MNLLFNFKLTLMEQVNKKYWHTNKGFVNPKGNDTTLGFRFATIRWLWSRMMTKPYRIGIDLPNNHILAHEEALALFGKYANTSSLTWLGHASFLFRINGVSILTDPLLFGCPGPAFLKGLHRIPSPLQPEDFDMDVLLLSHEHLDHIHHPSLRSLKEKESIQPIVPLGVGQKIQNHGFKNATELDWFEGVDIGNSIKITAVPAVHYSNFSNTTLWAGFVISFVDSGGTEKKIYFAGDTDYGAFMKRDVASYGPFDIACIGVGGFYLPFPSRAEIVHTNPEEAVQTSKDVNAKKLIGMHWGTMKMADEDPNEILPRMHKHAEKIDYKGEVIMLRIGETKGI